MILQVPYLNFALEEYLMKEKDLDDNEIFMFLENETYSNGG